MDQYTEVFVGIDVAKTRNAVAIAEGERGGTNARSVASSAAHAPDRKFCSLSPCAILEEIKLIPAHPTEHILQDRMPALVKPNGFRSDVTVRNGRSNLRPWLACKYAFVRVERFPVHIANAPGPMRLYEWARPTDEPPDPELVAGLSQDGSRHPATP